MITDVVKLIGFLKDFRTNSGDISKKEVDEQLGNIRNAMNSTSRNSIVNKAKNSVCQFPLLLSSNVSLESTKKLCKTLEQLYSCYLSITISNEAEVVDLGRGDTKNALVRSVHQNDTPNYGFENANDVIDAGLDLISVGSLNENNLILSIPYDKRITKDILIEANKQLLSLYTNNMNHLSLNNTLNEAYSGRSHTSMFDIEDLDDLMNDYHEVMNSHSANSKEYKEAYRKYKICSDQMERLEKRYKEDKRTDEEKKISNDRISSMIKHDIGTLGKINEKNYKDPQFKDYLGNVGSKSWDDVKKDIDEKLLRAGTTLSNIAAENEVLSKRMKRTVSDIQIKYTKALNNIAPTILNITVKYSSKNGGMQDTNLMIGVKVIPHIIKFEELLYYIPNSLIKKKKLFRFIQWTTGEIKASDFLFDISGQKFEGKNANKLNSVKWFRHLKARSFAAKKYAITNKDKSVNPNASLVLTTEDINIMKIKYNLDLLTNTGYAKKLMDLFFLLGLYVIDEVDEQLYVFSNYNNGGMWEKYSLKKYEDDVLKDYIKTLNKLS